MVSDAGIAGSSLSAVQNLWKIPKVFMNLCLKKGTMNVSSLGDTC